MAEQDDRRNDPHWLALDARCKLSFCIEACSELPRLKEDSLHGLSHILDQVHGQLADLCDLLDVPGGWTGIPEVDHPTVSTEAGYTAVLGDSAAAYGAAYVLETMLGSSIVGLCDEAAQHGRGLTPMECDAVAHQLRDARIRAKALVAYLDGPPFDELIGAETDGGDTRTEP